MTKEMQLLQLALSATSKRLDRVAKKISRPEWVPAVPEGRLYHVRAIMRARMERY